MRLRFLFLSAMILFIEPALSDIEKDKQGSSLRPLSFGDDQTIVDLKKVIWEPLKVNGLPSGAEIAVLRGNLESGNSESLLRLQRAHSQSHKR